MQKNFKKKIIALSLAIGIATSMYAIQSLATTFSSSSFSVFDPVLSAGSSKSVSSSFGLGQSIGQSVIGKSISTNFQVWSGFQYYAAASAFVLSGIPGNTQVMLSWVPPHTYLGARVASYEVGIGTVSGSYTFQDVGTVNTFTKTGLTNSTPYYFIIKAKSGNGSVLSFSQEFMTTPVATTNSGGGGGGSGGSSSNTGGGNIGNATLTIKGIAYPGAQVTILRDGVIDAVTTADQGALFNVTVNHIIASTYTFSVYATDTSGRKSASYSFPVTLTDFVSVLIDNVFLAPTIGVNNIQVKKGDPIEIFGTAAPNAQVNVYVHSANEFIEKVNSSNAGAWFKQFDTSFLEIGDHITFSKQVKGAQVTTPSESVAFAVGDTNIKADTLCARSDLNCDKKINITDLSMLLYYWKKKVDPIKIRADINKDSVVNAIDFSILLYDWTG